MSNNFVQDLIENIQETEILEIIKSLGGVLVKTLPNQMWFNTFCHSGDSHKLCYFRDTKNFYCYTNCGKMSLFDLIMQVKNCNFKDSLSYVRKNTNYRTNRYGYGQDTMFLNQESKKMEQIKQCRCSKHKGFEETPLPVLKQDNLLNFFESVYYDGWINEGISVDTMRKYNIKWYAMAKHIIIPHYDLNNNLVGIRRRTLDPAEAIYSGKYMPEVFQNQVFAHSLGLNLYGLNHTKNQIQQQQRAIIVEGEKSVLLSDSFYQDESIAVATCGFNVTNWQRDALLNLGVKEIILGFDKDFDVTDYQGQYVLEQDYRRFQFFQNRINNIAKKFWGRATVYILQDTEKLLNKKDSPFDQGKEVLEHLISHKKLVNNI